MESIFGPKTGVHFYHLTRSSNGRLRIATLQSRKPRMIYPKSQDQLKTDQSKRSDHSATSRLRIVSDAKEQYIDI